MWNHHIPAMSALDQASAHFTRNLARGVADMKIVLQGFYTILVEDLSYKSMCGFMGRFLLVTTG